MALHEEDRFLSFKKLDDALWHRYEQVEEDEDDEPSKEQPIDLWFMFAIVVLGGDLMEVAADSRRIRPRKSGRVRFQYSSIHDGAQYTTHIDVVTERSFRRLLKLLDSEFDEIYRRVHMEGDALEAAIKGGNLVADEPPGTDSN